MSCVPRALIAATEQLGIKVGTGRMHPSVEFDSQFDTNPGSLPSERRYQDLFLSIRPGVNIEYPTPQLELKTNLAFEYRRYLGIDSELTRRLSSFLGRALVEAQFNPQGHVRLHIANSFIRHAEPGNQTFYHRLLHSQNETTAQVDMIPFGGALKFAVEYSYFFDYYDRTTINAALEPRALDNTRHRLSPQITWKFLPKTALILDGNFLQTDYNNVPFGNSDLVNSDSKSFSGTLGAIGNLTRKTTLTLKFGYERLLIINPSTRNEQTNQWLVTTTFTYQMSETGQFQFDYTRDNQPTSLFQYVSANTATIAYEQQILGEFNALCKLSYGYNTFGEAITTPDSGAILPRRKDQRFTATLEFSYALFPWARLSLHPSYEKLVSNFVPEANSTEDVTSPSTVNYERFAIFFRLQMRY